MLSRESASSSAIFWNPALQTCPTSQICLSSSNYRSSSRNIWFNLLLVKFENRDNTWINLKSCITLSDWIKFRGSTKIVQSDKIRRLYFKSFVLVLYVFHIVMLSEPDWLFMIKEHLVLGGWWKFFSFFKNCRWWKF